MPSKGGVPSLLHDVGMGEAALGWQGYEQEEASCGEWSGSCSGGGGGGDGGSGSGGGGRGGALKIS